MPSEDTNRIKTSPNKNNKKHEKNSQNV